MICKYGRREIPSGQNGRYFICHLKGREGRSCRWARWDYGQEKYVATTPRNGSTCSDMELVTEEVIGLETPILEKESIEVEIVETKKVISKPRKTSVKTTSAPAKTVTKKPCGCGK